MLVVTCVGSSLKTLQGTESDHVAIGAAVASLWQMLDINRSVDQIHLPYSCSEVVTTNGIMFSLNH